jgi:surface-anchored protein
VLLLAVACGEGPASDGEGFAQGGHAGADCELTYAAGHGDLFVTFDAGLDVVIRASFGGPEELVPPERVCVVVPRESYELAVSLGGVPASEGYAFLGANPGDPFWLLPQAPRAGMPWFGASTEDVPTAVFADDRVELSVTPADVPEGGHVAAWTTDAFGAPSAIFATATGKLSQGYSTGAHVHFNWAFTTGGTYTLAFAVVAERAGVRMASEPRSLRFLVER